MENLAPLRNPCFCYPAPYYHQVNDPVVEMWAKPLWEFNRKYSGGIDCYMTGGIFHSCRPLYRDHEKVGKSTSRFSQT